MDPDSVRAILAGQRVLLEAIKTVNERIDAEHEWMKGQLQVEHDWLSERLSLQDERPKSVLIGSEDFEGKLGK